MKPLCIDLFCGLGGWADGFLAEDYDVIGFDIERHDYGAGGYPGDLVLQDVLTLHGSQFKDAAVIVASPPCQEYSYMAMPWSRAKQIAAEYRSGVRDVKKLTALFDACFRIQREALEAAGRHIPMIVENVRGAQPWVGPAKASFGSFMLWGDIAQVGRRLMRPDMKEPWLKVPTRLVKWESSGSWFGIEPNGETHAQRGPHGIKVSGLDWSKFGQEDYKAQGFNVTAAQNYRKGTGGTWFTYENSPDTSGRGHWKDGACITRHFSSKSDSRKAASAQIAKIPFPLANWIAKCFKPA